MKKDFLNSIGIRKKTPEEIHFISPLVYAYIGDAIYEVYIRTYIFHRYRGNVNIMHQIATRFVKAGAQAAVVRALEDQWSEEEWGIIKRGRNQKSGSVPKNANLSDYRYATGFEALLGYLYLMDKHDRIEEIIKRAIEVIEGEKIHTLE
ncbi:Mini-ribonuclease 3 [Thermotalea metallivorans]|uniref:Mini-ribonuclease 3 n=1 Tax=Thermotalea metallivorans TaxID=520762 RepID=A0A140L2N2_9FIRM|nr:ribonuclease III domain-containing protein [Thermotalea metallivorans]KXG74807.1 Mini-ribonuclease 3 [Thermotalea metallivorans]